MRLAARGDSTLERLALSLNLVPPAEVDLMAGMGISRVLIAAARLGVLAELARGPATLDELASRCGLATEPAALLVSSLTDFRYLRLRAGRYDFRRRARKWLDPASPMSVVSLLDHGGDFWDQWTGLEDVVRTGRPPGPQDSGPEDPYWRRYVTGQFDRARQHAPELVRRLKLPAGSRSLLDVAGGHGWFAAELCRRHPGLRATVLDLPASTAIGREIIAAAGMSDRVTHLDGDVLSGDLGGPHDAALCFNLIQHLTDEQAASLMKRLHDALRPGGVLAILSPISSAQSAAIKNSGIGLFFYLEFGGNPYRTIDLSRWLGDSGFGQPARVQVRSMPFHHLYTATRLPD
jgi:SAM-dependent methyltransferase